MKAILSEKNLVVILFVMVLVIFSLAQEDSKKMEKLQAGVNTSTASTLIAEYLPNPVKDEAVSIPRK